MAIALNQIEEEVVFLKAIYDLIDSMVNHQMLSVVGGEPCSSVVFKSSIHHQLFIILLTDFLSQTDKDAPIKKKSYIRALKFITEHPSFNVDNSVDCLREATNRFSDWLDEQVPTEVWLPTISTQATLNVSRTTLIKMCGNMSKHNFLRLIGVATQFQEMLQQSGVSVTLHEALLTLDDFYERWGADILRYHGSALAEFLNNIRWAIYDYLRPEFQRSFMRLEGDPHGRYAYKYPVNLTAEFARECYWNLMNDVRRVPYIARFEVPKILKLNY
jgi:hypothetical protein